MKLISVSASAGITGFESAAAEYTQLKLSLDDILIDHPSSTFLGRASGNSMEGVGIFDGDILIIDRFVEVRNLDVIVANYNGHFTCKIIDKINRLLISTSKDYPAVTINELDTFTIEGVVTRSIRCHRVSNLLSHE